MSLDALGMLATRLHPDATTACREVERTGSYVGTCQNQNISLIQAGTQEELKKKQDPNIIREVQGKQRDRNHWVCWD